MSETTTVHVFVGWCLKQQQQSMFLLHDSACWTVSETTTVHVFVRWANMLDDVWNYNNSPCFCKVSQHAGWCLKQQQSMFLLDDVWNINNSPCFCMVSHHYGWHGWKWAQVVGWHLEQQHSNNPCQVSQHVMWNFHLKLEHQHIPVTIHKNRNYVG